MADKYSNVDIKKFGDLQQQNAAGHNLRQIPSEKVDPKKTHLNKFYIGSANMNFNQVLSSKLSKFKIRKNAVKSVNLVFSASPELFQDKAKGKLWEQQTFEFICKEFGTDNIVYAVVHHDEQNPHFQVSVVPVDPKGKLNASHFFDGVKKCNEFVTRYNQAVKKLGLKRDKGKNKAKPQATQNFYRLVNESDSFNSSLEKTANSVKNKLEKQSRLGFVKTSLVLTLLKPLLELLQRYKAKDIANRKKLEEAEILAAQNNDLKLKFENMGLSHDLKFSDCTEIKQLIADGQSLRNTPGNIIPKIESNETSLSRTAKPH